MGNSYKDTPLWDSSLPLEKRLDYLMAELTLEEKFQCLGTGCPAIERLGIREFYVGGEGAHGVQARHDQSFDRGEPQATTIFPNPIGMSATWDEELIKQAGRVVGNEARAVFSKEGRGGLCLWAPTVDLERDPRWGRTEEGYGEDPYLAGKMSASYIRGLRGEDPFYLRCGATLKHFYANNVEEGRVWKSSSIDPRNKYEYYLEPFRRAAVEGGAEAMMTAYNEVNGIPALINEEVQRIAKEQWGIHHVVCDGGDMKQTVNCHRYFGSHTETIAAGLAAGLDCFTDDIEDVIAGAREAYELGMISMEDIDRALRCHFGTMIRLGLFDAVVRNPYADIGEEELNTKENQQIACDMAKESVVLLKNAPLENDMPLLPLVREEKLAVIGPLADAWYKDWYSGIPPYQVTPMEGIRRYIADGNGLSAVCEPALPQVMLGCKDGYLGLLEDGKTIGIVPQQQAEIFEITLWDKNQATLRCLRNGLLLTTEDGQNEDKTYRPGIVTASKEEAFGWFVKEVFHLSWEGESFVSALREGLEVTLRSWKEEPFYLDEQGRLRVPEEEGFVEQGRLVPKDSTGYRRLPALHPVMVRDATQEAARLAAESDTVLLMVGPNPVINCKEEVDRRDIDLPLYQQELIREVFRANSRVVLCLISNIPFSCVWEQEHIPAIVTMASGCMELGTALADVLFGKAAPAGRLNMTWYRDLKGLPDMDDYDIIQGERTYQYYRGEVLYPFGHGLTYSPVGYHNLRVTLCDRTSLQIQLQITNEGQYPTDEVVQIYVAKKDSVVKRALHQLKGFVRVKGIQPGETREVFLNIPLVDLQYYDVVEGQMLLEPGEYEIQAGASSKDIRLRERVMLKGTRRGVRHGDRWNPADHYDCSEHAILGEGHMGVCSVEPLRCIESGSQAKTVSQAQEISNAEMGSHAETGGQAEPTGCARKRMQLVYENVFLQQMPTELVLDAQLEQAAKVCVYVDDVLVGEFTKPFSGRETETVICEGWAAGKGTAGSDYRRGFGEIRLPLVGLSTDFSAFCLKLVGTGDVKICRWKFV